MTEENQDLWAAENARKWMTAISELEQAHRTELDEETREIYLKHLTGHLSLEQFEGVIKESPVLCRGFPSIAELLEIGGIETPKVKTQRDAEDLWRKLRSSKELHKLTVTNIALKIVNEMGGRGIGPHAFGAWAPDQERWKRLEFIKRYSELSREMELEEIAPRPEIEQKKKWEPLQRYSPEQLAAWREWDPAFAGKTDHQKGQVVAKEMLRRTKAGLRQTPLTEHMLFSDWCKDIPKLKPIKDSGQSGFVPLGQALETLVDDQAQPWVNE